MSARARSSVCMFTLIKHYFKECQTAHITIAVYTLTLLFPLPLLDICLEQLHCVCVCVRERVWVNGFIECRTQSMMAMLVRWNDYFEFVISQTVWCIELQFVAATVII